MQFKNIARLATILLVIVGFLGCNKISNPLSDSNSLNQISVDSGKRFDKSDITSVVILKNGTQIIEILNRSVSGVISLNEGGNSDIYHVHFIDAFGNTLDLDDGRIKLCCSVTNKNCVAAKTVNSSIGCYFTLKGLETGSSNLCLSLAAKYNHFYKAPVIGLQVTSSNSANM